MTNNVDRLARAPRITGGPSIRASVGAVKRRGEIRDNALNRRMRYAVFVDALCKTYAESKHLVIVQIFLAFISCITFVVETYGRRFERDSTIVCLNWVMGIVFLVDFLISLYLSGEPLRYVCTYQGLAELLSVRRH